MKFTLMLLTCLVGVSYQQRHLWTPIQLHVPRIHLLPAYFNQRDALEASYPQVNGRERNFPQRRFFANFISSLVSPSIVIATDTWTTVEQAVVTTAIVSNCIPPGQFVDGSGATSCPRKRRSIDHLIDEELQPSQPELVVVSEMPEVREWRQSDFQLLPSIEHPEADETVSIRQGLLSGFPLRQPTITFTVTATETKTDYSFVSTVIKNTVKLASEDKQLNCLPAGFIFC